MTQWNIWYSVVTNWLSLDSYAIDQSIANMCRHTLDIFHNLFLFHACVFLQNHECFRDFPGNPIWNSDDANITDTRMTQ